MLSSNFPPTIADRNEFSQCCRVETLSLDRIDSIQPGESFELTVRLSNESDNPDQSIDVTVSLAGLPEDERVTWFLYESEERNLFKQPCRLALFPGQSQEVTFKLTADAGALPQLVKYYIIVKQANSNIELDPIALKLRILPIDRSEVSTENPTFYFEPQASATSPLKLSPLAGTIMPIQVWVDNRSELVDRFQLRCEGLPKDWEVSIQYPQMSLGTGLMLPATGLGLNPRDRGHIQLIIKPSPTAYAGIYSPTLQIVSSNNPRLKLLHLLYLEVQPHYQLQPSLHSLRDQFRKGPGSFELELNNTGNTPRQIKVKVEPLAEGDRYQYQLKNKRLGNPQPIDVTPSETGANSRTNSRTRKGDVQSQVALKVLPQQTEIVELAVIPKRGWRRPWIGGGDLAKFRVNIADTEGHSLVPATFQGNTTWMARPWWQLLLAVLLALGLLGSAAGLVWWFFLRPSTVLSIEPTQSKYFAVTDDFAQVDFKLRYSNDIQALRLTGYDPEGKISSAPIVYDFQDIAQQHKFQAGTLPQGLDSRCSVQAWRRILTCRQVHTGARVPGEYVFQLDVVSNNRREDSQTSQQTVPVVIEPVPEPTLLVTNGVAFTEPAATGLTEDEAKTISLSSLESFPKDGLELSLEAFQLEQFGSITLAGKTSDGKTFAEESYGISRSGQTFSLQKQTLEGIATTDEPLRCDQSSGGYKSSCEISTNIWTAGTFYLEAMLNPPKESASKAVAKTAASEPIFIQPLPTKIERFMITGGSISPVASNVSTNVKDAFSYVFLIDPSKFDPASKSEAIVSWKVSGGESMKVELLLPEPVTISQGNKTAGRYAVPLTPGENKTIGLQVTDANGNKKAASIEIQVIGPALPTAAEIAEQTAAQTGKALADALKEILGEGDGAQGDNGDASQPDQPAELPPRFNEGVSQPEIDRPVELPPQFN